MRSWADDRRCCWRSCPSLIPPQLGAAGDLLGTGGSSSLDPTDTLRIDPRDRTGGSPRTRDRPKMADQVSESQVDGLTDLFTAFQLLHQLNINPSGITDLEQAKCRLLQYLKDQYGAGQRKHVNATDLMQAVLDEDRMRRDALTDLYHEAEVYLGRLPVGRRRELENLIPSIDEHFCGNKRNLKKNDCAILIAGEVSAGKSSLLNLLLAEDLLPTSLLSCTSVICELKYGVTKVAMVHPWDPNKQPIRVELEGEGDDAATRALAQYVHQHGPRITAFPYKRVEIYWPCELLKTGMVIVDSPGIGESREMTRMVKEYLPAAFAFIYVINSSNAGGLQPDRLQDLLAELCRKRDEDEFHIFDPSAAIFVCNKWDQVPPEEMRYVIKDTRDKLKRCWPGLRENQIVMLSTTKAIKSFRESGFVTQDYNQLLEGIETLFPISLRCKMEAHYRWLSRLLRRSAFHLRAYIADETRTDEQRKELTEYLHHQLDKLENEARRVIEDLESDVNQRAQEARERLVAHLDDPTTRGRLTFWEDNECPEGEDWDALNEVLTAKVNRRIRREVSEWDSKNNVFAEIQTDMLSKFQDEFSLMEDQLGILEGNLVGGNKQENLEDAYAAIRALKLEAASSGLTMNQKIALGLAAPLLLPLGVVVGLFALPVAGVRALRAKLEEMRLLKNYRTNKTEALSVMTDGILNGFVERNSLQKLIREQLSNVTTNVETLIKTIPTLIEADRNLILKLQEERTASEVSLAEEYLPLYFNCLQLLGKLDLYYVRNIRTFEFQTNEVEWNLNSPVLSTGEFGTTYQCKAKSDQCWRDACVRVHQRLANDTVTEILMEEEYLRKLRHDNIITYYGACGHLQDGVFRLLLVLEPCNQTLRSFTTGVDAKNPGKVGDNVILLRGAKRQLHCFARQLYKGLSHMHERNLVHRDLKPETILLNERDVIKLADIGMTKLEGDLADIVYPVSPYSAPEVIEGREYSKSADVFSASFILWELWYGVHVTDEISSRFAGKYDTCIREGSRPSLTKSTEAPDNIKDLLILCWNQQPTGRPSTMECLQFFENIENIPGKG